MNKSIRAATTIVGLTVLGASAGWAQQNEGPMAKQLLGTWTYVKSESIRADGSRTPAFSGTAKGVLMFDANGRFTQLIVSSDRPKFTSNNRLKGTPDENRAAVHGAIGNFGTYSVDEAGKAIIYQVEGSTFPNSEGATQRRPILTLTRDELKYTTAGTTGMAVEAIWKRAR